MPTNPKPKQYLVSKMVRYVLCNRQLKTEWGLSVHLARIHNILGIHGRLSLEIMTNFFPLLEKHLWAKAESFLIKESKL
jgi:hypothetical protein